MRPTSLSLPARLTRLPSQRAQARSGGSLSALIRQGDSTGTAIPPRAGLSEIAVAVEVRGG